MKDTPVWKDSARLYVGIDELAHSPGFQGGGDLRDQLLRATLSISNNIAEGFDRGSTNELIQYLYHARGSAGEVRSMLTIMQGIDRFSDLRSQISDFRSRADAIGRQLHGWATSFRTPTFRAAGISRSRHASSMSARPELGPSRRSWRRRSPKRVGDVKPANKIGAVRRGKRKNLKSEI